MRSEGEAEVAVGRLRMDFVGAYGDAPSHPCINTERLRRARELDCIRHLLPDDVLEAAHERARQIGTSADRVLIARGMIDEETYLRALACSLDIAFEPLDDIARADCLFNDQRLIEEAIATRLLPLECDDGLTVVVAPRGAVVRRIIHLIDDHPACATRFRLTSNASFNQFVMRCSGKTLAARACDVLKHGWPTMSCASQTGFGGYSALTSIAVFPIPAFLFAPSATMTTFGVLLAAIFLGWLVLRLTGALIRRRPPVRSIGPPDEPFPVYSIIAALYREAASVNDLLAAIERFDYPAEQLDVIFAIEADDCDTLAAITAAKTHLAVTVVVVPAGGPRTKPKALNVALPFARGKFTVVYDAEDRPEPGQLLDVLQAFSDGGDDLACVQARLCIDNTADSWLTRYFTAEYASQFDAFLPGLTALRLPLPLGGSSNHFYTETLRKVGGWDPYNVTEDADLGMRLARFGYRADMIASTTYEEAPAKTGAWLRQRTRWFKGWLQTWLVHMRQPYRLLRQLKLPGFIAFQLMIGGNVLAALVHPLFLIGLLYQLASGGGVWRGDDASAVAFGVLYGTTAIIGYLSSAFLGWLGLSRRGLLSTAWVLALTPVYWLLLSLAAWRAAYQLVVAPHAWEKTEHGLAKSSRLHKIESV